MGDKSIHHDVLLWEKEIPPSVPNNLSETRQNLVSDKIILVFGWDFFVPQQYTLGHGIISSEIRLCQVSDEFILVLGWGGGDSNKARLKPVSLATETS